MKLGEVDICMLVHNNVKYDGRVLKEATSLANNGWRVVIIGMILDKETIPVEEEVNGFTIFRQKPNLFRHQKGGIGKYLRFFSVLWSTIKHLRRMNAKIYHAHDFPALLHMFIAGLGRRRIVYDSHELFFDRLSMSSVAFFEWLLKQFRPLEKFMAKRVEAVITVGEHFADHLMLSLDIERPVVVRNAVDIRKNQPSDVKFPTKGEFTVVHTGFIVARSRHIEELISAFANLPDNINLAVMGKLVSGMETFQTIIETHQLQGRVHFVPPVSPWAVVPTIQQAQLSAILLVTHTLSNRLTLPNKLFEAISAGLPVVVGPNDETVSIVKQYNIGVICDSTDPKSIASAIGQVLDPENYAKFKAGAERARQDINWENEEKKLIGLYEKLLN